MKQEVGKSGERRLCNHLHIELDTVLRVGLRIHRGHIEVHRQGDDPVATIAMNEEDIFHGHSTKHNFSCKLRLHEPFISPQQPTLGCLTCQSSAASLCHLVCTRESSAGQSRLDRQQ